MPDGRIQTVTYTADEVGGFKARVTYEGTTIYPPEPKEGYGVYSRLGSYPQAGLKALVPHRQSVGEGSNKIVCSAFVIGPGQQSSFMYSECPLIEQYNRFQKYVYVGPPPTLSPNQEILSTFWVFQKETLQVQVYRGWNKQPCKSKVCAPRVLTFN